jgi:uncharacterized protein
MLDASSLRMQLGKHVVAINFLAASIETHETLREGMGHTRVEIAAGILVGIGVAAAVRVALA